MVEVGNVSYSSDVEPTSIDVIVKAFQQKFGDRAAEIAAAQIERAGPDTVGIWREIATELERLCRSSATKQDNRQ